MQSPHKPHLNVVRRTLQYVKSTTHYGLFYEHGRDLDVHGYTDVDWAGSENKQEEEEATMTPNSNVYYTP